MNLTRLFLLITGTFALALPAQAASIRDEIDVRLQELNGLLASSITWQVEETTQIKSPHSGEGVIYIPSTDLQRWESRPYGEETSDALAFLIAHEFSHNFIDFTPYIAKAPIEPDFRDEILDRLHLVTPLDRELGGLLGHENVDSFAAKLLHELNRPIESGARFLRDIARAYALTGDVAIQESSVSEVRANSLRIAYTEGWKDWSNYRKLNSPCAKHADLTFQYLKKVGSPALLKSIGPEPCRYFIADEIVRTFEDGRSRY